MENIEFELSLRPKFSYAFLKTDARNRLKVNKLPLTDQLSLPQKMPSAIAQNYPELAEALKATRKEI